jgi:hypothetical protein
MKSAAWLLLLLVACAGPGPDSFAPVTPISTPGPDCPSCPTCEKQTDPTCPESPPCPECPKPPEPVARDWHCMDLDPPKEQGSSFCWLSASVCESYHQQVVKDPKQYGKPSACTTQQIAFCFSLWNPRTMIRQMRCARTLEDCKVRRQLGIVAPETKHMQASACESAQNTDTFSDTDDGNELNPLP